MSLPVADEYLSIDYTAEPTPARFHSYDDFFRGIMGPVGSGKTVACVIEILQRAVRQKAYNTIRRSRWAAIRNTYPELKTTTIKTWQDWIPESIGRMRWDTPITCFVRFPLPDGTKVELEVIFLALDQPRDVKKLKSLELTGIWINEVSELPKAVLDMSTSRVGRFPPQKWGGPSWTGIITDTNPPDDDHWYYKLAEEERPAGYRFFRQPGALIQVGNDYVPNPEAENIRNHALGFNYYLNMIPGKKWDWVNVFVLGNYGSVQDGKPVYPEYNDKIHASETELTVYRGLPLLLGWDFGLTPACVICQLSPNGQFRVLNELVATDMGIRRFSTEIVKPFLLNNYAEMSIVSIGDPAGNQRAQTAEKTCLMELDDAGIPTESAITNEFIARREAVAGLLNGMADGAPRFLLSPTCRVLRKGMNGAYKYERVQVKGDERYKDAPKKNSYSHVCEALQYIALHVDRGHGRRASSRPVESRSSAGWT